MNLRCLAALLLLALTACGKQDGDEKKPAAEKAEAETGVSLKAEEIKSLGITTQPAQAASYRAAVSGYGVVVALDSFAQLDADVQLRQVRIAPDDGVSTGAHVEHAVGAMFAIGGVQEVEIGLAFRGFAQADDDVGAALFQHKQAAFQRAVADVQRQAAAPGQLADNLGVGTAIDPVVFGLPRQQFIERQHQRRFGMRRHCRQRCQ